jgi:hypothetical protein
MNIYTIFQATSVISFLSNLLFAILAFAMAKRNVKLFLVPLAMRTAAGLIDVIVSLLISLTSYNFTSTFLSPVYLILTVLHIAVFIVFCLTVTGNIKNKLPFVIIMIVSATFDVFTAAYNARLMIQMGIITWEEIWLSPVRSFLISAAYIFLGLSLSNNPHRRYYQTPARIPRPNP